MTTTVQYVFDASPLIAGCQFFVGNASVAESVLNGLNAVIPPAVFDEVVVRGGTRPDAREAARIVTAGLVRVADAPAVGNILDELKYYQLGLGEKEALTLVSRSSGSAILVTDDFLALITAGRLGLSATLFLDFIVERVRRGEIQRGHAERFVQALSSRYPQGFVPHTLDKIGRCAP